MKLCSTEFMGIEPAAGGGLIIQVRLYFITEVHTDVSANL